MLLLETFWANSVFQKVKFKLATRKQTNCVYEVSYNNLTKLRDKILLYKDK